MVAVCAKVQEQCAREYVIKRAQVARNRAARAHKCKSGAAPNNAKAGAMGDYGGSFRRHHQLVFKGRQ